MAEKMPNEKQESRQDFYDNIPDFVPCLENDLEVQIQLQGETLFKDSCFLLSHSLLSSLVSSRTHYYSCSSNLNSRGFTDQEARSQYGSCFRFCLVLQLFFASSAKADRKLNKKKPLKNIIGQRENRFKIHILKNARKKRLFTK